MTDAFVSYKYRPTSDTLAVPEWMWGKSLAVHIPLTLIERLYGHSPGDLTPEQVANVNQSDIDQAVKRKIGQAKERPAEPIELTFDDFVL